MRKQKSKKGIFTSVKEIYYSAPQVWYTILGIVIAVLIWVVLFFSLFVWQVNQMKKEDIARCEHAHQILLDVENQCNELVRNIYKESELQQDFWLFWNYNIEGYMEQRILQSGSGGGVASFPEYMNVFITEHQDIYCKIYLITSNAVYTLRAQPEGGGGVYAYNVSYSQYMEEGQNGAEGYPVTVNVQNINNVKKNSGKIVFLVDYDYVYGGLKSEYSNYALLKYGNVSRIWGDADKKKGSPDFWTYWTLYECKMHGNRIEIGFQVPDILRRGRILFLIMTGTVVFGVAIVLVWGYRMTKRNEEFLEQFILTIQHAKTGKFGRVAVGKRKDNYAMLAEEINDMIRELDLRIKKEYILKIYQQKAEMKAMLYQINPHFLYNTLEIIKAQANIEGNVKVADALFDLGSMYRMLVKLDDAICMRQELELLTHYLNILELGNQENFYYEIDVDEDLMDLETVKFWIQPLAENYYVHGYDRTKEYNLFSIQGSMKEDGYYIQVMDNGRGMNQEEMDALNEELSHLTGVPKEHVGIRNVCQRLRYFYRNKVTFQISENLPRGLCVEIFIEKDWKGSEGADYQEDPSGQ